MSGAIVVAGECCWGSQCKCPSPDMRLFTCTACRSQYHHLCADTGCPQREELDKRTECCNCAPAAAAADIAAVVARPARNRVSTAGNKDRLDAQMEGGDQEQTRVARAARHNALYTTISFTTIYHHLHTTPMDSSTLSTYNYLNVEYLSTFSSIQGLDIDFHMVSHTKCVGEVDIDFHTRCSPSGQAEGLQHGLNPADHHPAAAGPRSR